MATYTSTSQFDLTEFDSQSVYWSRIHLFKWSIRYLDKFMGAKFPLISTVWDKFIENSQNRYKPGANITIDELLFSTKARCRFTQYLPNKPDKFGVKFWLASDVQIKYVVNGFPYLGKSEKGLPETV